MNHRERVLTAAHLRQPDRVPLFYRDVPEVEERLRRDLGLADRDALLEHFDIDFRWVGPDYIGPPLEDPDAGTRRDIWGVTYRYAETETGGHWEHAHRPLESVTDPAALDDHPWPVLDLFDFSVLADQLARYDDFALMTQGGVASPGIVMTMIDLIGIERALTDMMINVPFFDALAERICAFNVAFAERLFEHTGDRLDFYRMGDDFGTQRGLLFGVRQYRQRVMPYLQRMAAPARRHGALYYHHSCGAIRPLIPSLIETGVDVLDPLQVKAVDMNPRELKAAFGNRLCFSGGVDEQELLPRGTPEDVRCGVRMLCDVMAPGGGFFIGPTHNFQSDIPTANIVALYQAARECRYS